MVDLVGHLAPRIKKQFKMLQVEERWWDTPLILHGRYGRWHEYHATFPHRVSLMHFVGFAWTSFSMLFHGYFPTSVLPLFTFHAITQGVTIYWDCCLRGHLFQYLLLYETGGELFIFLFATLLFCNGRHGGLLSKITLWVPIVRHCEEEMLRGHLKWLLWDNFINIGHWPL
jgi:hypothetical protein